MTGFAANKVLALLMSGVMVVPTPKFKAKIGRIEDDTAVTYIYMLTEVFVKMYIDLMYR